MQVMGISGLPGSGKSLVSESAAAKGAIIVSMGDIVREEAKKRGEGSKETAVNLRKEHGEYIVSELTIKKIKKLQEDWEEEYVAHIISYGQLPNGQKKEPGRFTPVQVLPQVGLRTEQ